MLITHIEAAYTAAEFLAPMRRYNYDSTAIRRPFDCVSKVIKVTMTEHHRWPASRSGAHLFIGVDLARDAVRVFIVRSLYKFVASNYQFVFICVILCIPWML